MCEPTTIAMVGAAAIGAYASYEDGQYRKEVGKYNARVAENEAIQTRNKGTEEERIHREKVQQLVSSQRARFAANNVDVAFGTPGQLQDDTIIMGEADALRIRNNFQTQASASDSQSMLSNLAGQQAANQGILQGASTLGSGVASGWYQYNNQG